jgi:hypothetical protein
MNVGDTWTTSAFARGRGLSNMTCVQSQAHQASNGRLRERESEGGALQELVLSPVGQ